MPNVLVSAYVFVRRKGYSHEDASDLTQAFFARFLEKRYLRSVDANLGKFRTFLLTSVTHFLANEWDKSQAQRRGGGIRVISLDETAADRRRRGYSTGGVYSVNGTVGQPAAGPTMSSGNFSVTGGFWGLLSVVQTASVPLLTIRPTATNAVIVSWPSPSPGFILQQKTNGLASATWNNVTSTINDDGTVKTLIVNPPSGSRFYRLFKP